MNLSTDRTKGVAIIRVGETTLMYPLLSTFAESITTLLANGETHLIIDISQVVYVDSASIGCLMDLYRQATQAGRRAEAGRCPKASGNYVDDDRRPELHRVAPRRV